MRKFKLINIIGIDGAGKTTLARSLVADLKNTDKNIYYRYCQYFAKLLYPVKLLAKFSVMRKTDEFGDYGHYNSTKKATSHRFPCLTSLYATIWLIDYLIQVFFKATIPVVFGRKLIIDRYIFDIAVNLSLTTDNEMNYADKVIRFFFFFAPRPDLIVFIDLPVEVAFSRKDDIQNIEYLKERRERYLALAEIYNFKFLDGTMSREQMLIEARSIINSNG